MNQKLVLPSVPLLLCSTLEHKTHCLQNRKKKTVHQLTIIYKKVILRQSPATCYPYLISFRFNKFTVGLS